MTRLKLKHPIALLLLCTLLTGCWSRKEINESAIVAAIGVDRAEAGYRVSVLITNHGQVKLQGGENQASSVLYEASGTTVRDALKLMTDFLSRRLDFTHNWLIAIGEEQAKVGIAPILDHFIRAPEVRPAVLVAIAQGSAKELLSRQTHLTTLEAKAITYAVRKAQERTGRSRYVTALQALATLAHPDLALTLPVIAAQAPNTAGGNQIDTNGLAVLKRGRLIGHLTPSETSQLLALTNETRETTATYPCPNDDGKDFTLVVRESNTLPKARITQGKVAVTLATTLHGDLSEYACPSPLRSEQDLHRLRNHWQQVAEKRLQMVITKLQEQEADALGLAELIYRTKPAFYNSLRGRWQEYLPEVNIQLEVDAQLHLVGGQEEPILPDMKEDQ